MTLRPLFVAGGLAASLVALLAVEYHATTLGNAKLSAAESHKSAVRAGLPRDIALLARDDIQVRVETILARPLFRPDRRPPANAASASGPDGLPRLSGVLVSPTGKSLIFAGGADGKSVVVAEGGRIGAYVVRSIGVGEAVISGPQGTRTVRPAFGKEGAAPIAIATPPIASPAYSILDRLRNGPPPAVGMSGLDPLANVANPSGTAPEVPGTGK